MNLKSVEPHLHGSQTEQESVAIFTLQAGFVIFTQIKGMNMLSCTAVFLTCSIFYCRQLLHRFVCLFMAYKICRSIQRYAKSKISNLLGLV